MISTRVTLNIDCSKIVTSPVHKSSSFSHYQLENNDYRKECKVMWSQYLLANDDFPEYIKAKFEHCCVIRIQIGNIDISQCFEADS